MSGGVDSSTAAWLLKKEGYEVIGATMCIGSSERGETGAYRCCGLSDIEDARRVALQLGIPFYVFPLREEFEREIIDYFCREYQEGKTPNPCILCNEKLKFGSFLRKAMEMGVEYVSTGHYARLECYDKEGPYLLRRGVDRKKDQSYFLFTLKQEQLQHILFPLGTYLKEEVRRMAFEAGLRIHDKPESQEVCFISESSYHSFLKERLKEAVVSGPIFNRKGEVLGTHRGIAFYTIGQRRGLRLAKGKPLYVIEVDRERNAIIVGDETEVYRDTFTISSINWISTDPPALPLRCQAKIRYNHPGAEAIVYPGEGDCLEVKFRVPQKAITPGQAAVFYQGDVVLGGGWIKEVRSSGRCVRS